MNHSCFHCGVFFIQSSVN
ncbi:MAG: hypothetical protein CBC67_04945 [Gammaproteobacteria bacterium TMED107]|nr:hypothetical protein [Gammaproteobacteria bacterium]OUX75293.1 MAG: hypothetical protein CBC67_04945 [Gammaproteobacteria bacterium TMED107]